MLSPSADVIPFHFYYFFLADTNNLAFELFGNLATSTPMKGSLPTGFNGSNNHNYIQVTPPKNSFDNFQVRNKKSMSHFNDFPCWMFPLLTRYSLIISPLILYNWIFLQFDNRSLQRNLSYDCNVTTPTTPSTPGSSTAFQNSPPYG